MRVLEHILTSINARTPATVTVRPGCVLLSQTPGGAITFLYTFRNWARNSQVETVPHNKGSSDQQHNYDDDVDTPSLKVGGARPCTYARTSGYGRCLSSVCFHSITLVYGPLLCMANTSPKFNQNCASQSTLGRWFFVSKHQAILGATLCFSLSPM